MSAYTPPDKIEIYAAARAQTEIDMIGTQSTGAGANHA